MMDEYDLLIFVFVFILFLHSAKIVNEDIKQNVQNQMNFCVIGLLVLAQHHLLIAERFIDLRDLIGIEVDLSHHVLIEL